MLIFNDSKKGERYTADLAAFKPPPQTEKRGEASRHSRADPKKHYCKQTTLRLEKN